MTYGGSSSSTTGTYFGYDSMGRVNVQKQVTGSNTYSLSYTYNLAGLLATETYPTSRVLTHSYDNAGRLSQISDGTTSFASSFTYAPSGGMLSETWGNGAVHSIVYNNALQVSQIKLKQSSSGSELQRYEYLYGKVTQSNGSVDKSKNNGQIGRIDDIINGSSTKEWEQRFSYDELGRLSTAAEYQQGAGSTPSWKQEFTYDRYGNRFQSGSGNTGVGFTPVLSSDITAGTNRFISTGSTPITYDAAGNITQDAKFRFMNYSYDANGRQVSASATNSDLSQTAVYDCAGQRVQTTSFGATRTLVYDIFGQQIADYNGPTMERENIYRGGQLLAVYEATSTCHLTIPDFVTSFYQGALNRNPNSSELAEWTGKLSQAQAQGNGRLIKVAQDLGAASFTSSEYNHNNSDSDYVTDLYSAFLQRSPDSGGLTYWLNALNSGSSRTDVRNGFAYSLEFQGNVVRLCTGASSGTSTSANLKYVLTDLQGSARALMDNSGSGTSTIIARHDYLPFGEEIFAGAGLRTTTQKYSVTDKVRQRFAMTERDEATGLDHTWFRKYDSFAGRWTSPDALSGSVADPQSFNHYSYAANDPMNFIDPLGLDPIGVLGGALGSAAAANPFIFEIVQVPFDDDEMDIERSSGEPTEATLMPRPAQDPQNTGQQFLIDALAEAKKRLQNDNCANLFGGEEKALKKLDELKFKFGSLDNGGIAEINGKNVTLDSNSFGPQGATLAFATNLRESTVQGNPSTSFTSRTLKITGATFGAFVLLHELGHRNKIYGKYDKDGGSQYSNLPAGVNNEMIRAGCFDELTPN
jgi:RHS repeat-associated protein